jgi:hypothetical protein
LRGRVLMMDCKPKPGKWLSVFLCLSVLCLFGCSVQKTGSKMDSARADGTWEGDPAATEHGGLEKAALRVDYLTPATAIKSPEIFIYKEKRRLYVIQSNVLVRDYPIGLGSHPGGDKDRDGDGKTPEGDFVICIKAPSSARSLKSLAINYPARRHGEKAYFSGLITPLELRDILNASDKKTPPPWGTVLGGKIFIQAGGAQKDWTDGSVALYDSDMEELFQVASVGTPVSIRP